MSIFAKFVDFQTKIVNSYIVRLGLVDCVTINHCSLRTTEFPTFEMTPLQGQYTVRIVVLLLFCRSIFINVHRPIPDLLFLFCNITNDILFKVNVVVPPGLQTLFHCRLDSDVHVVIFFIWPYPHLDIMWLYR